MRILHICESYPPDYGGGAAVYAADICFGLARRGHEVRVLTTEGGMAADYSVRSSIDRDITVRRVTLNRFKLSDPEGWSLGLRGYREHEVHVDALIRAEVGLWRPDVVHLHTTRPFGEQQFFTLQALGLPVVAMAHEAWLVCVRLMLLRSPQSRSCTGPSRSRCLLCVYSHYDGFWKGAAKLPWRLLRQGPLPAYRLSRREAARSAPALVLAYSRFMSRVLEPHVRAVRYVPLGVTHPSTPPPAPDRPRTPFRFGFFAGAQPTKGLADVLTASMDLRRRGLALEVFIWGSDRERVLELIASRSAQDVARFRGVYSAENMWAAYSEVDAALMATRVTEPFGRIPQEAALARIPSIVPDVGGLTEQIRHGKDGLLFSFRDTTDLAVQMEHLLTEPGLYRKLVDGLWEVRDTAGAMSDIEDAYHQVLTGQEIG